jgi:RNA polymerase sigma-70 factor (ECF subfamily)
MKTDTITDLAAQRDRFVQFVRRRVGSNAVAEDIVQSAYIRASEKASSLRNGESSVAWFYRILRNAVIDYYRHRSVEDRALERWVQDLQTETPRDTETEEIVCQCINTVLQNLKPAYNQILRDVDIAGKSLDAVAESSGITAGNAAVRVHRARQALKKELIELCGTCCPQSCGNCTCP